MPYQVTKLKNGKYQLRGPSGVHAKGSTKAKVDAQLRLLQGIEHGWRPTGKKK